MVGEPSNAITDIMRKLFHMALTKPSREIVYTLISDIEVQNGLEQTADPESAAQTYSDLQKEAESFFSSISERAASGRWRKRSSPYLCYRVTALAYQGLPPMPPLPPCPHFIRMGRPRDEAVIRLPPEFYAECTVATEKLMHEQAINDEKWRKMQDPTIEVIDHSLVNWRICDFRPKTSLNRSGLKS